MNDQPDGKFQTVIGKFVYGWSALALLLGIPAIAVSLWFAWVHRSTLAESVVETVFYLSIAWGFVSALQAQLGLRKLKLSSSESMGVFSGSRPTDPDELYAWKWVWQFMYAVILGMLSVVAIPVTDWLTGK
jgi:hypothetical protein